MAQTLANRPNDPSGQGSLGGEVGGRPVAHWVAEELLVVGDTEFVVTADAERYLREESTASRFIVAKHRAMVDHLADRISELLPGRIVELGIFKGGSAALLTELARPVRLSAIDLDDQPNEALREFIAERRLEGALRPHYGVDQGNVARLAAILDADHGAEPLDLVVDDASHTYRETRASFEVLFARLRPGGLYIIEDWSWAHYPDPLWQDGGGWFHDRPALTNLVIELLMIAGTDRSLISEIEVLKDTVTVKRGPLRLDRPLRIEHHYKNRGVQFRPLL